MQVLLVENLHKRYGRIYAVNGVSFSVAKGEIFGLLGPNGAGKTTSIECMVGLRRPNDGSIHIAGLDVWRSGNDVKQRIGVQLQATALHEHITVVEALRLFASFYRRRADVPGLLKRFALEEKVNARFEMLSGGQKQRLALALALVNEPEVIFLDEPTANLDAQSRRELHDLIRQMKLDGRTVLLTTHYIEEAEQLCDRLAIVDHGQIIAEGTPAELIQRAGKHPRLEITTSRPLDADSLRRLTGVQEVKIDGSAAVLATTSVGQTIIELVQLLGRLDIELLDLHVKRASVEDVFIEMTGRAIRD